MELIHKVLLPHSLPEKETSSRNLTLCLFIGSCIESVQVGLLYLLRAIWLFKHLQMKGKKLGIFLYNRLFDPVIQSNFWLYIKDILERDKNDSLEIYLITYENAEFPISVEQKKLVERWKSRGLIWVALRWHPGIGLSAKTKDGLQGFFALLRLRMRGCAHFVSLASVAGSYLYLYHLLLRFDFYLYQFEPHSEYAVDNGMWKQSSLQYKIAHYLEKKSAMAAKVISSGTRFMKHRLLHEWKVKARFFKIPSVANDQKFLYNATHRQEVRKRLGVSEETNILLYPGKFGDLYYREEMAFMYKWLREMDDSFHLLIITPHQDQEVIDIFNLAKVDRCHYTIAHSDYADIHRYYSAADFAIISVPPGPSKKFISNIKVGEYLCAGLPYLITEGVSEDYLFAIERKVGIVVKDFKEADVKSAFNGIREFLMMDKSELRLRCRQAGIEYRGFDKLNATLKEALNTLYQ